MISVGSHGLQCGFEQDALFNLWGQLTSWSLANALPKGSYLPLCVSVCLCVCVFSSSKRAVLKNPLKQAHILNRQWTFAVQKVTTKITGRALETAGSTHSSRGFFRLALLVDEQPEMLAARLPEADQGPVLAKDLLLHLLHAGKGIPRASDIDLITGMRSCPKRIEQSWESTVEAASLQIKPVSLELRNSDSKRAVTASSAA